MALLPVGLSAAVIRGSVVENQTSRALARALVQLQPVAGTQAQAVSVRTNIYGSFEFSSLPAGAYVIKASRRGFRPAEYGQKQWNSAGVPIKVAVDDAPFVTIRLPRYGSITGTIVDENDVGLPDFAVLAYRDTQPPELVEQGRTDERGVYRIAGLDPGNYLVRTAPRQDESMEYLPTFAKETLRVEETRSVPVFLDEEARNADVRPVPGRLVTLSGMADTAPANIPVTITLASDTGRQVISTPAFRFPGLVPGNYEIYAEAPEDPARGIRYQSAYMQLRLAGDTSIHLVLQPVRESRFEIVPALSNAERIAIKARRKDLAGVGPVEVLPLRPLLPSGRWELLLTPPPGYYVSVFSAVGAPQPSARPDGWNEITANSFLVWRYTLATGPASVQGTVTAQGSPAVGAPVYLEGYDPANRKRVLDLISTRTGLRGEYRFDGLAPGVYRVLATFEYDAPDSATMEAAGARAVQVDAHNALQLDLDLFQIR